MSSASASGATSLTGPVLRFDGDCVTEAAIAGRSRAAGHDDVWEPVAAATPHPMIIVGLVLLLLGLLLGVPLLWTLGVIVLIVGLVLMLLGSTGRAIGGRRHYW